jgi:hypothetical protein
VLWQGPNLYEFVGNSPINYVDYFGLYGNPISGPNGPVGPSSPYVPGGPYYPNGYLYHPTQPASDPCLAEAANEYKTCMESFRQTLCLREAYDSLQRQREAMDGVLASNTGPVQKIVAFALGWELKLSTALYGSFIGGGAVGCASRAAGVYGACLIENMP